MYCGCSGILPPGGIIWLLLLAGSFTALLAALCKLCTHACSCESEDLAWFYAVLTLNVEDKVKNPIRFSSYSSHQEPYLLK